LAKSVAVLLQPAVPGTCATPSEALNDRPSSVPAEVAGSNDLPGQLRALKSAALSPEWSRSGVAIARRDQYASLHLVSDVA
jgi:hypothetical protein